MTTPQTGKANAARESGLMAVRTATTGPPSPPAAAHLRFGVFELDEANACLLRDGKALMLPPTPFAVLCALVRRPGCLLTKDGLLDEVWGHQFVSESVLKSVITKLRTILEDDSRQPRFIETVSRRGYRFIATVTPLPGSASAQAGAPATALSQAQPFIGRENELTRLHNAWDCACSGSRKLVWVAGDLGIGKTTLIERFVTGLGDVVCARGQCVEQYGSGEPYLPVLDALAELCRRDSTVAPMLRVVAPTWLLQLPWLSTAQERESVRRDLAGVGQDRMLREMGELLDRYTESRPLLLVTEDLHWSDSATLQLMNHVARRRGSACLMWLASFRLAEVVALDHPLKELREELRLHGLCEEIVLDPFSEREVAHYVAERAPLMAADEAFVRALHDRTNGVPLFVAHVIRDAIERAAHGSPDSDPATQLAKMAVPENLASIIDHYIAKLTPEQRMLLEAAAVCGVDFRVSTIADALERDAAWVDEICEGLVRGQLWLAAPRAGEGDNTWDHPYSFRHALFRRAMYERVGPLARVRLHQKVGAALERERAAGRQVTAVELATHFERGREPIPALRYYAEAAEAAVRNLNPAEAMTLTERGLALLDQAPKETGRDTLDSMEITLATLRGMAATNVIGIGPEAKSAFQRAYSRLSDVPQHPMRRRLLHGLGFVLCLRAEYAEALEVADRAEALSSETNDPVLMLAACVVHGEVHQLQGESGAARSWIERGLAVARRFDVELGETFVADPQITLLGLLSIELLRLGLAEQGRARLQQAYARANHLTQPMARLVAIWFEALFEVRLGDTQRVAGLAGEMRALADEFALAEGRIACRWFQGWADARSGEPREGYRRIREAYEENTRLGMLAGGSEVRGYAAEALLLAGDWEGTLEQLAEAFRFADAHQERVYVSQLFLIEAAVAHARGQSAAAYASIRHAIEEGRAQQAPWLELVALLELCERGGATAEDGHALAALVDQLPEAIATAAVGRAKAVLHVMKLA
jgi:DNA-binding winged helix-turn-helix (wHTH) protein